MWTPPRGRMSTGLPGKWLAPLMDQERLRKGGKAELDYESSEESQRAALLSAPRRTEPTQGLRPQRVFHGIRCPAGREGPDTLSSAWWGWREFGGVTAVTCAAGGVSGLSVPLQKGTHGPPEGCCEAGIASGDRGQGGIAKNTPSRATGAELKTHQRRPGGLASEAASARTSTWKQGGPDLRPG